MKIQQVASLGCWCRIAAGIVLALPAAAPWAAEFVCPPLIRVAYADTELPPYVLGVGDDIRNPPGLFVAWTRKAIERLGCRQALQEQRLPYNRIVSNMATGTVDVRVTGGYRPDIVDIMRFPLRDRAANPALAVAEADTRLYVLKGSKALTWDGTSLRFSGPNPTIGTVRGHFSEKVLQARKWDVDSAPTWDANVKKLLSGRVAAIAGTDSVVDALPQRKLMETLDPPVQYDLFFAPVSNQFYEKYPAFTLRFWLEICRESRATFKKLPPCSIN